MEALKKIDAAYAKQIIEKRLHKVGVMDARQQLEDIMQRGAAFEGSGMVLVISKHKGMCWVDAMVSKHSQGADFQACVQQVERYAVANGFTKTGFQTARLGLVHLTKKLGYQPFDNNGKTAYYKELT